MLIQKAFWHVNLTNSAFSVEFEKALNKANQNDPLEWAMCPRPEELYNPDQSEFLHFNSNIFCKASKDYAAGEFKGRCRLSLFL